MERKATCVIYNYNNCNNLEDTYAIYTVGMNGVKEICYHQPSGEGDAHYCDITFEDGREIRQFNINSVDFK